MKLQFGETLKKLRKGKDITQEKLSEILGISAQSISRWELGVCYPDVELLPIIANYFGVSIDKLLANDNISKKEDREHFNIRYQEFEYGSKEQLEFAKEYCHKYPNDDFYVWSYCCVLSTYILKNRGSGTKYLPLLRKNTERLLENAHYRNSALELMIAACNEDELDSWLDFCPYLSIFNRRGALVSRYNRRMDYERMYIHQGLEALESYSNQLDRRYPDSFGAARKAEYHKKILNIIENFGDGIEPPDGWKLFYAYKQLVLSACLFGDGKIDEGWQEFGSAIDKYKYIFSLNQDYLDIGGELFSNLKVNKGWTEAISEKGEKFDLFGIGYLSFYSADFLYNFLTNPRWAWFNSVRDDPRFVQAVNWAESKR